MSSQPTERLRRILEYGVLAVVVVMPTQAGVPLLKLERATVTLTAGDIMVWMLAAIAFGWWLLGRDRSALQWPPIHLWLLAVAAVVSAAAWLDPGLGKKEVLSAAKEVFQWIGFCVATPLVFLNGLSTADARRRAMTAWVAVTAITVLIAIVQAAAQSQGVAPSWLAATRHFETEPLPVDPASVVGLFGSRTVYGIYLCLSLPVVMGLMLGAHGAPARLGLALVLIVGVASMALEGPYLAVVVGLCTVGALAYTTRPAKTVGVITALTVCAGGLLIGPFRQEKLAWHLMSERLVAAEETAGGDLGPSVAPADEDLPWVPGEGPESVAGGDEGLEPAPADEDLPWVPGEGPEGEEQPTQKPSTHEPPQPSPVRYVSEPVIAQRYAEWGAAVQMMGSRTWPVAAIGAGPGQYQEAIGGYYLSLPKQGKLEPDFQSQYLVVACELGLPGLFALVLYFTGTLQAGRRALAAAAERDRGLLAGLIGAVAAALVVNFAGCPIVRGTSVTLALVACLILVQARSSRR